MSKLWVLFFWGCFAWGMQDTGESNLKNKDGWVNDIPDYPSATGRHWSQITPAEEIKESMNNGGEKKTDAQELKKSGTKYLVARATTLQKTKK